VPDVTTTCSDSVDTALTWQPMDNWAALPTRSFRQADKLELKEKIYFAWTGNSPGRFVSGAR